VCVSFVKNIKLGQEKLEVFYSIINFETILISKYFQMLDCYIPIFVIKLEKCEFIIT